MVSWYVPLFLETVLHVRGVLNVEPSFRTLGLIRQLIAMNVWMKAEAPLQKVVLFVGDSVNNACLKVFAQRADVSMPGIISLAGLIFAFGIGLNKMCRRHRRHHLRFAGAVASSTHQVHRSSFVKEQFQVLNQFVDISFAGDVMNSWAIGIPIVLVTIMEVLTAMLD